MDTEPTIQEVSKAIQDVEVERKEFESILNNLLSHPPRPRATVSAHIHTRREQSKRAAKPPE